jgi:ABC-type polysaccharide/polyol phosphate export permease
MTGFFTVAFTLILRSDIPNYPVFFLAGLLAWNFLNLSILGSAGAVTQNSALVNRVYFPRAILPLAVVAANAVNFLIALAPLALLMVFFGVPFTLALAWFPVILFVQFAFALGVGLGVAALNVYWRDLQQIIEALMLPWFFLTPILYSLDGPGLSPVMRQAALWANPMASLVTHYRQIIYYGQAPDLGLLGLTAIEAALVLVIGLALFHRLSPHFADEL